MILAEKLAITYLIASTETPVLTSHSYCNGEVTIHNSHENIKRLLDSPDFKAGWNACRDEFRRALEFIQTGTVKELRQYGRQRV